MTASQRVFKVRRHYNKWVADQTMEDYALRFTAGKARHMPISRVGKTALGATAFLALEGIAAAVTLSYGFYNTVAAMLVVCTLFFIIGFPIAYHSAKHGLDIDLLTRGAGFGYMGSTVTSLIYASFTFLFFAIEAAILASALNLLFNIPLALGYFLCAVAVIPIVTHGITAISKFQVGTQGIWIVLQCTALVVVVAYEFPQVGAWTEFKPDAAQQGGFDILLFGAAASVLFAMVAQIGEQVDYLRFLPEKNAKNSKEWWTWLVLAGPGWVFIGMIKMLLGSFLAYLAVTSGASVLEASDPTRMYQRVFTYLTESPSVSLVLAGLMVIVSQMKINVTNAYAGSIAWSNFFSRVTHSHPGRVVWLVFNVTLALILMELGIYQALEAILGVFAIVAVSWLGSLAADLLINKPLGLSPSFVEFKRAHLYDINPVGVGSMILASSMGLLCYLGVFGEVTAQLSHFVSLAVCFVSVPAIAILTKSRFYLARQSIEMIPVRVERNVYGFKTSIHKCVICENEFESPDMSHCSAYESAICSLCCSLDVRCLDSCKPKARLSDQALALMHLLFPHRWVKRINSRFGRFLGLWALMGMLNAALVSVVYRQLQTDTQAEAHLLSQAMVMMYFILLIVSGVVAWLFLLAHESRLVAQTESNRQTRKLVREIEAHKLTDFALQQAKELAERANDAKSRYLSGISHELRTPLQSILGYAQLLAENPVTPPSHRDGLNTIQRSGQYLTDLIEGLLDISKIEAGRLGLNKSQVNLPDFIAEMNTLFGLQASQKGIRFVCEVLDPLPTMVSTDEKRLRQILINVLSNAVKYTREGGVVLQIRYRNQVAEFKVQDTGPGISVDDQERIFQPFERIRNQDTMNLPGTGLGLTIVRLLTDVMGGNLKLQSEVGQGSTFTVTLMLPWVQSPKALPEEPLLIKGYQGPRRTVCLVDDDPVLRGFLSDLLVPLGFQVLEANNGQACVQLLESISEVQNIDLFILDVAMPVMDGLSLVRHLRKTGYTQPVLMLSADLNEQHRQDEDKFLFSEYLIKPINNQKLLQTIGVHLDLEWEYLPKNDAEAHRLSPNLPFHEKLSFPKTALLAELQVNAEMGYRKGVLLVLEQLEHLPDMPKPTLTHLQDLTRMCQFERMSQLLAEVPR
ncbi:MAG: ATP-binding protein [Limnobacter sp.]|nr:ATP-binding protein [Limnobacter sp.]